MKTTEAQKRVYENKVKHGFNLKDINFEFCLLYGEVGEAYHAWLMKEDGLGSELADVGIYLLGLSEMLGINLGEEIEKKMAINEKRVYKRAANGVLVKENK